MKRIISIFGSILVLTLLLSACKRLPAVEFEELHEPGDAGWWNEAVFYEIFVRSFHDSNGDGIGDLTGILEKLDYLNDYNPDSSTDLGVTALWLMPVFPTNSYHGYDVIDYRNIDPDYGTLKDFKQLVDAAHQRGMRVILDLVINHTSSDNPWFLVSQDPTSPYRDWYLWSDENPGWYGDDGRTVWHAAGGDYYYGYFGSGMPDLNYNNEEVTSEMLDIARFWAVDMGVDGFRIDAARYLIETGKVIINTHETHAWFADFYSDLRNIKPDIYLVGEVWSYSMEAAAYVTNREMTNTFDFDLSTAILNAVNGRNASRLNTVLARDYQKFDYGNMGVFQTNHDMPRVMSQFGGDVSKARLGAFLLLTAPGIPYIYYGEEIGMLGGKPDELIRTPMQWSDDEYCGFSEVQPWEPVNTDCPVVNLEDELTDPDSLWSTYVTLIHMRQAFPAISGGDYFAVKSDKPAVYSALRVSQGQAVLLIANLGLKDAENVHLSLDAGPLGGDYELGGQYEQQQPAPLSANATGGFDAFVPIPAIPALQYYIYVLNPR